MNSHVHVKKMETKNGAQPDVATAVQQIPRPGTASAMIPSLTLKPSADDDEAEIIKPAPAT